MRDTDSFDDRTAQALLDGRVPPGRDDLAPLASFLSEVRAFGDGTPPQPNAALASVLADGLPADLTTDKGELPVTAGSKVHGPAEQVSGLPKWRRVPTMISALLSTLAAKFAALGVAGKAAVVLTTSAAAAGGAVAADLPQAVSDALNRGEQTPVVEEVDEADLPENLPEDSEFGTGVSDDAADPEAPGVSGPDTADEARERAAERRPDDPSDGAADEGLNRARENTADTPAQIPAQTGPGAADGRRPQDVPAGKPEGVPGGQSEDTPRGEPEDTPDGQPEGTPDEPEGAPQGQPEDGPGGQPDSVPPATAPGGGARP